jgi:hypothetical protein
MVKQAAALPFIKHIVHQIQVTATSCRRGTAPISSPTPDRTLCGEF